MKTLTAILTLMFAMQAQAADVSIINYKDWMAAKVDSHIATEKGACLASTKVRGKDTYLEVYAEENEQGGYVQPMVQVITTDVAPALGIVASIDGVRMPMTISLKETKEIEVTQPGSPIPVKVEQQVFVGKFKDKEQMIRLIRAKNRFQVSFYSSNGVIAKETFSLRGSSHTVKTMMENCL